MGRRCWVRAWECCLARVGAARSADRSRSACANRVSSCGRPRPRRAHAKDLAELIRPEGDQAERCADQPAQRCTPPQGRARLHGEGNAGERTGSDQGNADGDDLPARQRLPAPLPAAFPQQPRGAASRRRPWRQLVLIRPAGRLIHGSTLARSAGGDSARHSCCVRRHRRIGMASPRTRLSSRCRGVLPRLRIAGSLRTP
jgi:hypothetical protein